MCGRHRASKCCNLFEYILWLTGLEQDDKAYPVDKSGNVASPPQWKKLLNPHALRK